MAYGPMVKELYHWESLWFMLLAPLNLIEIRKMRGNFARVLEGFTDSRMDFFWYVFLICRKQTLLSSFFSEVRCNKSRWKGIFKPTFLHEKTNHGSREPAWPPLSETTGRNVVVRSKSWSERMMAIIESTIPPPLPDETGWPGDPEKISKAL